MLGIQTMALGMHFAVLDPMTGSGLLLRPPVVVDVYIDGESILAADWNSALHTLNAAGWEPTKGADGAIVEEGLTADGCVVVGLVGRDPVVSEPSLTECMDSFTELRRVAGLIPTQH